MIAIALIRVISATLLGTEDQAWNSFWVQMEASVSIFAACPTAFRSLFLVNRFSRTAANERPLIEPMWKRSKPNLQSIHIGATLTGVRTVINGGRDLQVESQEDGADHLLTASSHKPLYTPNGSLISEGKIRAMCD